MRYTLAVAIGVAYVLLGVSLVFTPGWFLETDWGSRSGLLTAAAIRFVVGVALLLAATTSKYPRTLRIFGTLALVAGLTMPFVPPDVWAEYMRWWVVENPAAFRWVRAIAGTLFGAFIVYAALPRRTAA